MHTNKGFPKLKIASKKYKGGGGGGVSDAKKTQLFPQKVILMQYRPKIQEYRPSCGKKGHNGGGGGGVRGGCIFWTQFFPS